MERKVKVTPRTPKPREIVLDRGYQPGRDNSGYQPNKPSTPTNVRKPSGGTGIQPGNSNGTGKEK